MSKILITCFGAFDQYQDNPSMGVASYLKDQLLCDGIELPVAYNRIENDLLKQLKKNDYQYVFSFGLAGNRHLISLERVGLNFADSEAADNDGTILLETTIKNDGEQAYFSNLPLKKMCLDLNEQSVISEISLSAGSYVCNYLTYLLGYYQKQYNYQYCFIHLPIDKKIDPKAKWNDCYDYVDKLAIMINKLVLNSKRT